MDICGISAPADTWKDKVRRTLWPARHCELPEAPPTHKDVLITRTICELPIFARLQVLISGRFTVETRTVTEHEIGQNITASAGYALPPKFFDKH